MPMITAKKATEMLQCGNPHYIAAFVWLGILDAQKVGKVTAIDEDELRKFAEKYGKELNNNNNHHSEIDP